MNIYRHFTHRYRLIPLLAACFMLLVALFWTTNQVQAQSNNQYAVVITHVTTGMGDGCGGPEFYARINKPNSNRWTNSSVVEGRNFSPPKTRPSHLSPSHGGLPDNWGMWDYINEGETDRIKIRLMEADDTFCGGGDDHVDIARGSDRDLWLWVSRTNGNGWVYFEGAWQQCPLVSNHGYPYRICTITSRGTGKESATVKVSIQFPPVQ